MPPISFPRTLEVEYCVHGQHGLRALAAISIESRRTAAAAERAGGTRRVEGGVARIVVGEACGRGVGRRQLVLEAQLRTQLDHVADPMRVAQIPFDKLSLEPGSLAGIIVEIVGSESKYIVRIVGVVHIVDQRPFARG